MSNKNALLTVAEVAEALRVDDTLVIIKTRRSHLSENRYFPLIMPEFASPLSMSHCLLAFRLTISS
jgi:hypothetical protein